MKSQSKILFLILIGATPRLVGSQIPLSHRDWCDDDRPLIHVEGMREALTRSHVHVLSDTQVSRHSLGHWETKEKENLDIWYSNQVLLLAHDFFNAQRAWFEKNRGEVSAMPAGAQKNERWSKLWNHRISELEQTERIYEGLRQEYRRRAELIARWKQWYLDAPSTAADKIAVDLPLESKRREEAEAQIKNLVQATTELRKNF